MCRTEALARSIAKRVTAAATDVSRKAAGKGSADVTNAAARSASAGERLFAASSGAQSQPPRQRRWVVGRRAGHRRRAAAVVGYLRYKACKLIVLPFC